jgi:hypothetical protein
MLNLQQKKDLDNLLDEIYQEDSNKEVFEKSIVFSKNGTQISNLRTIAHSSTNLSSIKNFIKKQVGKDTSSKDWSKNAPDDFGSSLLKRIQEIEKKAASKHDDLEFKLKVVRGFINQLVSEFSYRGIISK